MEASAAPRAPGPTFIWGYKKTPCEIDSWEVWAKETVQEFILFGAGELSLIANKKVLGASV